MARGWAHAVALVAVAVMLAGCNVASVETCSNDGACGLRERCHPEGHFCELDTRPVVIGVSLPLTGDLSSLGQDLRTGVALAQQVLTEAGGVLGRPVEIELLDDESDVGLARDNVEQLVREGVAAVIGPVTSSQALESQSVTYAAQVLQISPTAGTPLLGTAQPENDRYFFRTVSTMRS